METSRFLCTTCGTQFAESESPPARCPICEDERQYVGWEGQQWMTLEKLREDHANEFKAVEPALTSIQTKPKFAIGQRALLVESPGGNVLWDCVSLIDDNTIQEVEKRGGLAAIAISHPHFYTSMVSWSRAFGGVPIHLHADDRQWVMQPDPTILFWEGDRRELHDSLALIRCGGHFAGSSILHWPKGADGRGAILTGDTLQVVPDRQHVGFMRSYPNLIPLSAESVHQAAQAVEPLAFDRVHGMFPGLTIEAGGKEAVARSAERYVRSISAIGP